MFYTNFIKRQIRSYASANTVPAKKGRYDNLGIINPSIGTTNLGDIIIHDAVHEHLRKIYPDAFFTQFPSQLHTSYDAKKLMAEKDFLVVGGTNLLSSNMDSYYQWKLDPGHKRFIPNKVVLMGVGWWQYQDDPNEYTANLLRGVLSKTRLHSVRDEYTKKKLNAIGIENVVNTTCPTLWNVTPDLCASLPKTKAREVITTLTFYKRNVADDAKLLNLLSSRYEKVHVWIQGIEDYDYLREIMPNADDFALVSPSVEAYNDILENHPDLEYAGTRLHAGIRAIQKGRRTMIVAVDNRAVEISKSTGLPVIERANVDQLAGFIDSPYETRITLPAEAIEAWAKSLAA